MQGQILDKSLISRYIGARGPFVYIGRRMRRLAKDGTLGALMSPVVAPLSPVVVTLQGQRERNFTTPRTEIRGANKAKTQ